MRRVLLDSEATETAAAEPDEAPAQEAAPDTEAVAEKTETDESPAEDAEGKTA